MSIKPILVFCLSLSLFACGGGGGGNSTPEPPPPPPPDPVPPTLTLSANTNVLEGETVTIIATSDIADGVEFTWQQLGGPTVDLVVNGNQASFVTPSVYRIDSELVDIGVSAVANGEDSGIYGITINVNNSFTLVDFAEDISLVGFSTAEAVSQLSNATVAIIDAVHQVQTDNILCRFDGQRETLTFRDNDQSDSLSAGDSITMDITECDSDVFDATVYGFVDIEILDYSSATGNYRASTNFSRLTVDNFSSVITTDGALILDYQQSTAGINMSLQLEDTLSFALNTQTFLNISELDFNKILSFDTAQYTISINGQFEDLINQKSYSIEQTENLVGFFNEVPREGSLIINDDTEDFQISVNSDLTQGLFDIILDDFTIVNRWEDVVEASLFGFFDTSFFTNVNPNNEFFLISRLDNPKLFGDDALFAVLFNRPLREINNQTVRFRSFDFPFTEIELNARNVGSVLVISAPDDLILPAATSFSLSGSFTVVSENNRTNDVFDLSFETQNQIIPDISASAFLYTQSQSPIVSAQGSQIDESLQTTLEWFEITDFGVEFESPTQTETQLLIPSELSEEFVIGLRITDGDEITAVAQQSVAYVPSPGNVILLDSEEGDYVGQGQQWTLAEQDVFEVQVPEFDTKAVTVLYNADSSWGVEIAPPEGQELIVGTYTGATRYPFQDATNPGLSVFGDGRGCNENYGEFTVNAIERDANNQITELSVDFVQTCESTNAPELRGKLRFNSEIEL